MPVPSAAAVLGRSARDVLLRTPERRSHRFTPVAHLCSHWNRRGIAVRGSRAANRPLGFNSASRFSDEERGTNGPEGWV